jgi:hypothetical protein
MNWRAGMFRVWIVASILWIGAASWAAYEKIAVPRQIAAQQQACADERKANTKLGNPFDCFDGAVMFDDLIPLGPQILRYAAIAIGPPLCILVFWFIGAWVAAGFSRQHR